jgi:hypothetical protein
MLVSSLFYCCIIVLLVTVEELNDFQQLPPSLRNGTKSSNGHTSLRAVHSKQSTGRPKSILISMLPLMFLKLYCCPINSRRIFFTSVNREGCSLSRYILLFCRPCFMLS